MTANTPKSRILESVHETAADLHRPGCIDQRKMPQYEALCLDTIPEYDSAHIRSRRDLRRVLSAAMAVHPDPRRALFLIKSAPIPAFCHQTLLQLVQQGRTEDAIGYLESIRPGCVG